MNPETKQVKRGMMSDKGAFGRAIRMEMIGFKRDLRIYIARLRYVMEAVQIKRWWKIPRPLWLYRKSERNYERWKREMRVKVLR